MQPESDNVTGDCLSHSIFASLLHDDRKIVAEITNIVKTIQSFLIKGKH